MNNLRPIRLCDLKPGERYVLGDMDQPYRLADALPYGTLHGSSVFYWRGDVKGQIVSTRRLTVRERMGLKDRGPREVAAGMDEGDWK